MTRREHELQRLLRDSHARTKAANRRCDDLFARLADAQRQINTLRSQTPDSRKLIDMRERAATLATALQATINNAGRISRMSGDAAMLAQAILDSAGTVVETRDKP